MSLKVFYDYISQPSRAVVILCRVNNVEFNSCIVSMLKGEHESEEYAKVNPFKRIPAIQDGDFILTESFAIMQYIASKYDCAPQWDPRDPKRRARVYEYVTWHQERLRAHATPYFVNKGIIPMTTGNPPDEVALKAQWGKVTEAFSIIESYFLRDQSFIGGDEISIADLIGACEVMEIAGVDRDFMRDHPVLQAWIHRVRKATNPHFDELHKVVYDMGKVTDPSQL